MWFLLVFLILYNNIVISGNGIEMCIPSHHRKFRKLWFYSCSLLPSALERGLSLVLNDTWKYKIILSTVSPLVMQCSTMQMALAPKITTCFAAGRAAAVNRTRSFAFSPISESRAISFCYHNNPT